MSQRFATRSDEMNEASRHLLVSLGKALRDARQDRHEDLYDAARYLRIKPSYLFGLEEGDISMTPGRAYALGFIRTYADHLGFDGNDVVRQVKQALAKDGAAPPLRYRTPIAAETARPSRFLLGLSIVMLGLVYGVWHIYFRGEPMLARVTEVPGELGRIAASFMNAPENGPVLAEAQAPAPNAEDEVAQAPLAPAQSSSEAPAASPNALDRPPASESPQASVVASAAPQQPAAAAPTEPQQAAGVTTTDLRNALSQARPAAAPAGGAAAEAATSPNVLPALPDHSPASDPMAAAAADVPRVVLLAREPSWIQVRSADRDFVRTMTLAPGQKLELPNRGDLALWTGNAGGLEVVLDGHELGTLGQSGRVVRDVPLAPDQLKGRFAAATPATAVN